MSRRLCQILTFPFQYHQGSPDLVPFHGWIIFLSVCVWCVYIMVSLSIHLSMDTKPASMSWLLQIILQWTLGTYRCKPHWPPKPGDLELSLGSNCKHQGTRQVHKFLLGDTVQLEWGREGKDGSCQPPSPQRMLNEKPAPQAEALR